MSLPPEDLVALQPDGSVSAVAAKASEESGSDPEATGRAE